MQKCYIYSKRAYFVGILSAGMFTWFFIELVLPEIFVNPFSLKMIAIYLGEFLFLSTTVYIWVLEPYANRPVCVDDEKITSYLFNKKYKEIYFEDMRVIKRPVEISVEKFNDKEKGQIFTLIGKDGTKIYLTNSILQPNYKEHQKYLVENRMQDEAGFYSSFAIKELMEYIERKIDRNKCRIVYQKQWWDGWIRKDLK
jgi:hypothetical protein